MKYNYEEHSNKSGIYKILNITNNRIYVGSSKRFKTRWKAHERALRLNKHSNKFLQADFNKCETDSFEFYVLEVMEGSTKEERLIKEDYWISQFYDSQDKCYNLYDYSTSPEGTFPKDSRKRKKLRSLAFKTTWKKPGMKEKMSLLSKARWKDPEYRAKVMEANSAPEVKQKRIEACKKTVKLGKTPFHLVSPDGVEYKGKNVMEFCRQHNLSFQQIYDVINERRRMTLGWKLFKNKKNRHKLLSPDGKMVEFDYIAPFCKQYVLSKHQIYKLLHGKLKCNNHKGWISI